MRSDKVDGGLQIFYCLTGVASPNRERSASDTGEWLAKTLAQQVTRISIRVKIPNAPLFSPLCYWLCERKGEGEEWRRVLLKLQKKLWFMTKKQYG